MKKRMIPRKDRPSKSVTIRMPEDLVEKLKLVAPSKGMSGYQPLMKFYISQGLREDLQRLWEEEQRAEARAEEVEQVLQKLDLNEDEKNEIRRLFRTTAERPTAHTT